MASDSDVLNASEAAAYLGAHVETVRRLARRSEIPSFKVGKDWRFRKKALIRWSEDQNRNSGRYFALLVDDDPSVGRAISRIMERIGWRTRRCDNGVDGLALVAEKVPDLILLDLKMPGMNGPEFMKQLRVKHLDMPVVIVTGYPDSDLMLQALQYGPLTLIAKPIDRAQLERTVRMLMSEPTGVSEEI